MVSDVEVNHLVSGGDHARLSRSCTFARGLGMTPSSWRGM